MSRGYRSKVGDTRTSPNGYHYTRTPDGWELTGRILGAQKLGRKLEANERIRYKDGDRTNLDPDNIEVYVAKAKSPAAQKAALEAKRDELEAQIAELEEQLSSNAK